MNADQPRIFGCIINNAKFWYRAKTDLFFRLQGQPRRVALRGTTRNELIDSPSLLFPPLLPVTHFTSQFSTRMQRRRIPRREWKPSPPPTPETDRRSSNATSVLQSLAKNGNGWIKGSSLVCKRDTLLVQYTGSRVGCLFFDGRKLSNPLYHLESIT